MQPLSITPGTYAIATQNFTAFGRNKLDGYNVHHFISFKTGDVCLVIENKEPYSTWPIKILYHGKAFYISNIDIYHFLYVRCSDLLKGKTFCISGELSRPKLVFEKAITLNSGVVKTTVNKTVDYLVTGNKKHSAKITKANSLKISILSEPELLVMIS